ncbi:extracellular solute-binding protein [Amycolatopsis jiangsuensis]|uniref:Raffinose/stachyose/melibiose transport system substrate-binding protein n=1 Tax=Amycolatopsis jiangsuensis TaxID=1181879 RepID=A0A840IWZ1_9PSEU|nr:extracellular solute-binding protein [Amycolatopsis jiangsuensis]MBB4686029.1 raffinose/stachyose/melibiose transport system substrate-binding protein [Amycolatopsis jiangsuensis]
MMNRRTTVPLLAAAALVVSLTSCAPGGSAPAAADLGPVSKNVGTEKITLTVWDQNTDQGIDRAQRELNKAFEQKYPNVTIDRVSRAFNDYKATLKLALSGEQPPDVVQANQGYPDMGAFVKAGLLRSLDDYAKLYGWDRYYPASLLKLNSFSRDGKNWQGDQLYGISQTGELIGLYYNPSVLAKAGIDHPPATVDELTADLAKVKTTGTVPLSYGDLEKYPGIHLYGFLLSALAGRDKVNDLVKSADGSWTGPEATKAAHTLQGWQRAGYLTTGANGISIDDAVSSFHNGKSAFLVAGTWFEADAQSPDARFTALTPPGSPNPVTMGGEGVSWAVTTKSRHADAAAAYVDFIAGKSTAEQLSKAGNLPIVEPRTHATGGLAEDIGHTYTTISKADGIAPYLDYTTPTFYTTLSAALQDLVAGQKTPEQFTQALEQDYTEFKKTRG